LRGRSPAHRRSRVSFAGHPCNACVAPCCGGIAPSPSIRGAPRTPTAYPRAALERARPFAAFSGPSIDGDSGSGHDPGIRARRRRLRPASRALGIVRPGVPGANDLRRHGAGPAAVAVRPIRAARPVSGHRQSRRRTVPPPPDRCPRPPIGQCPRSTAPRRLRHPQHPQPMPATQRPASLLGSETVVYRLDWHPFGPTAEALDNVAPPGKLRACAPP